MNITVNSNVTSTFKLSKHFDMDHAFLITPVLRANAQEKCLKLSILIEKNNLKQNKRYLFKIFNLDLNENLITIFHFQPIFNAAVNWKFKKNL